MEFYKQINLPPIPDEILNISIENTKQINDIGYEFQHKKNGILLKGCSYTTGNLSYLPLIQWLLDHIKGVDQQKFKGQFQGPGTHIVHSDHKRIAALNYVIDPGGENVITNWYKEKNKPLRRYKQSPGQQSDNGFVDYNNLELLESAKFEKYQWHLIHTDILHDVDYIETIRKKISISIVTSEQLMSF